MFETIGRSGDPGYWFRVLVAVWIQVICVVLLGYAVLGYVFLRFLAWLILALLALLFPIENPILWDVEEPPVLIEVTRVDDAASMGSFDVVDTPVEIDDTLPDLTPPPPEPLPPRRKAAVVEEQVQSLMLLKILGTTGSSSSISSIFGEGEIQGGLGTHDILAGGVEGGAAGGVIGSVSSGGAVDPRWPVRVAPDALHFTAKPQPPASDTSRDAVCTAELHFDAAGVAKVLRVRGCASQDESTVRRTLNRWRIRPHRVDGTATEVRTTIPVLFAR